MIIPSSRKHRLSGRGIAGVTLLEILVAGVIVAALVVLFLPVAGQLQQRNRETRCLHHIRQIGSLLTVAISEQSGVLDAWYTGTSGEFWNTLLVSRKYLTLKGLEALSCPNIPYADASGNYSGRHYGIYMPNTENLTDYRNAAGALTGRTYRIDLRRIATPSSTIFLGDSVNSSGDPTIRIFRSDSGSFASGAFHGRHRQRVNLFFYDGHTEGADSSRLYSLGIRKIYDEKLNPVSLTP